MIKRFLEVMKSLEFGFSEVDVKLNGFEFLGTLALGAVICAAPFIIKWILLVLHFGGG